MKRDTQQNKCRRSRRLIALAVGVLVSGVTATAQGQELPERVRALNNTLLQLHGRVQQGGPRTAAMLRRDAEVIIRERAASLEALIQTDPERALLLAFSSEALV